MAGQIGQIPRRRCVRLPDRIGAIDQGDIIELGAPYPLWLHDPKQTGLVQIAFGVPPGDLVNALAEYQKALTANPQSSLANYRIGELLFTQHNYQASVNSYRDALRGDGEPRWTEVWSHIALGKIFDITGQRDRAVNEYRLAVQTNDNTQGAVNEARQWLQKPYKVAESE